MPFNVLISSRTFAACPDGSTSREVDPAPLGKLEENNHRVPSKTPFERTRKQIECKSSSDLGWCRFAKSALYRHSVY